MPPTPEEINDWVDDDSTPEILFIVVIDTPPVLFDSEAITATAAVIQWMTEAGDDAVHWGASCGTRHHSGDWGDVDSEDAKANDYAVNTGGRLVSSYSIPPELAVFNAPDDALWFITEADRSVTTVLFPSDY